MSNNSNIIGSIIAAVTLAATLVGCTVGPDFKRPPPPDVATYTADPLPAQTESTPSRLGGSQLFIEGDRVNQKWWHDFGSPKLNALIHEALLNSPTMAKSQAALREAKEIYSAKAGSTRYPQVEANIYNQRQRFSPSASGWDGDATEFSLYNASVGVQYNLDLVGGNRRALEALSANVDYKRYQLKGAQLILAGNIVTAAITQARLAAQIRTTESILHAQEEQLDLTRSRVLLGESSPDDVLALQTQVEQTRAGLPLLRSQLQQNKHLLATLTGRPPGEKGLPVFTLEDFTLPAELPLTVPSELVRTRPDIQAAEALLHAANAEYGVAVANLYPQLNLSADLGSQALTTGTFFGSGSAIWGLVGQLTQPLFNAGLPAEKRAALAAFDAAAANYQDVVLESLRNVADVLRALDNNAQRLTALFAADEAASGSLESMQRQYSLGTASYVQVLIAIQQAEQTQINLINAQAQRLVDSAALYQAMGSESSNDAEQL